MPTACQVSFYVLQSEKQSPEQVACWLAMKAWSQGHQVAVRTASDAAAQQLDQLMWAFPDGRFLPHECDSESTAPVAIGAASQSFLGSRTVMINLDESPVEDATSYERLLEIVPAVEAHRLASRKKYQHYRNQGLDPASHPLNKQ